MAKVNLKLNAEVRTIVGKKVKQIRKQDKLPSTVYGKGFEAVSIQIDNREMAKVFKEVGESGLVDLVVGENTWPVIFRNPQYHPVDGKLLYIDCYKVNLKEKIVTMVPIVLVGESSAVKFGNVLVEVSNEVEVEALPADLPENISVDISNLTEVGMVITVADLVVDKVKVEVKTHAEQVIVKIEAPKVEEEPVVVETVAPVDVPATEQKTPEEKAAAEVQRKEEKEKEEKEKK